MFSLASCLPSAPSASGLTLLFGHFAGTMQLLDSSIALPVTDRIALLYNMRYDIDADTFLENYAGLRLLSSCNCWALNIGVTDTRNPNEVQVQAQFTLAGLGAPPSGGFQAY